MAPRKAYKPSKPPLLPLLLILGVAAAGWYAWSSLRESPGNAADRLAAQGLEANTDTFLSEIKAGHSANIHYFLVAGAQPGTQNEAGMSALMTAVDSGNKDVVAQLLAALPANRQEASGAVNLQESKTLQTALIIAVQKGDKDMVRLLLDHGADTGIADKTLQTPLIVAVRHKFANLLPPLIAADERQHQGASINSADSAGETPLTYAIRLNQPAMVDTLIAAKAEPVEPDRSGVTPLMVAAESGSTEVGERLIDFGAKPDTADRFGNTPLTIAIRRSHPAFARMLLDKGANADFHTNGPLPLQLVINTEPLDADLFSLLLARSKQGATIDVSVLFDAVDRKNSTLVKALIEHDAKSAKAVNAKGETLLYRAIENNLQDSALLLIDKGADINQTGIPGLTPLERATKHNEIEVVRKLLEMGAPADQKTAEGYTLAEMSVYSGYPEILDLLLAKGAKLQKDFGILWAIQDGKGKAVPVLLKYGALPNVMSNSGDPALWLASAAGETEAVSALVAHHAGIDYPNNAQSMTPLAIASHAGQLAVVKILVEAGAKLEIADGSGMTPLAHAAYMTKPDVVEYLIGKGANVRATDKQSRSAADLGALGEPSAARDRVISLLRQAKP